MGPDEHYSAKNLENHAVNIEKNLEIYIGESVYLSRSEKENLMKVIHDL